MFVRSFNKTRAGVCLVATAGVMAGCSPDKATGPRVNDPAARATSTTSPAIRPAEQPFFAIAADFPEFGGYYFDSTGALRAFTNNLQRAEQLQGRLAQEAGRRPVSARLKSSPRLAVVLEYAAFSFLELATWRDKLFHVGFSTIPGFHSIGVRQSENRIVIAVRTADARSAVEEFALAAGIPASAFTVRVENPEKNFSTLESFAPPFRGGLRITPSRDFALAVCALGFNVYDGTAFVTASHCTAERGPEDPLTATAA